MKYSYEVPVQGSVFNQYSQYIFSILISVAQANTVQKPEVPQSFAHYDVD